MWDVKAALKHLADHALANSVGRCALYIRNAVEAGGVTLERHLSAKDYGSSLARVGFVSQGQIDSGFQAGDVAVIGAVKGHPDGHICMFDGQNWVSDFKQLHGLYPSATYRKLKPGYVVYRYPGAAAAAAEPEAQP